MNAAEQFRDAIAAAGLTPPDEVIGDGKIHRFSTNGRKRDDAGWYVFHDDERPAGRFGCNRSGVDATWSAKSTKEFTPAERKAWRDRMEAARQQREADQQAERATCAATAADMWARAQPGDHPYAERKQITTDDARVLDGELLIPMRHGPGQLVGLQRIRPDGTKLFLKGTPAGGAYTVLGKPSKSGPIVICEGWATGKSVQAAAGHCVVVAFNAGNLEPVARKIRQALPEAMIIIAADDDFRTEGNPGITSADQAARAIRALVAIPRWLDDRGNGTDFNDLHAAEGLEAVRLCIDAAEPPYDDPTPDPPGDTIPQDHADSAEASVPENPASGGVAVSPPAAVAFDPDDRLIFTATPMKTAELFHATLPEGGRIIFWRGEFYSWDGCRYIVRDAVYMEQRLYLFMASCMTIKEDKNGDREIVAYNPKAANVRDVIHALRAVCYIDAPDAGHWIEPQPGDFPGSEIIAFQNCFLHWPTRTILPSTDRLLITTALEFDYNPLAAESCAWQKFLHGIWPDDQQSIDTLAEMFGYLLTDDTGQQKIFMLIGPPRSGKGTILRVLEALVGKSNRCSPSLSSLGGPFGLQSLLGKRMAMISDARLSGRSDQQPIVENLLRISGEDAVDVNRKNLPALEGVTLRARFIMATNELPAFSDASSALANRFVPFRFTRSFLGSEDQGLTSRLLSELPSILLWALDGLNRLRSRGHFVVPESAREISEDLLDQTSPIQSFVSDACILGDGYKVEKDDLYKAWKAWCEGQGRDHPGTKVGFGRQLHAAFPTIKRGQRREGVTRWEMYHGIGLRHDLSMGANPY